MMLRTALLAALLFCCGHDLAARSESAKPVAPGPVKVFILAGQSNMEGHGMVSHLNGLIDDPATSRRFRHLRDGNGRWVEREDVWIAYGNRRGNLVPGFGVSREKIGPELGFGWVMGENLRHQVLLIKTCWGGHSLKEKFLPPSSGGPGPSYTQMVQEVRDVLDNMKRYFKDYDGRGYEIAGFVWHQAWNDYVDGSQKPSYPDYTERQANLLRDLRKEFDVPNLPMTIGELGHAGPGGRGAFQKAQEATALMPEFSKSVRFVKTAEFMEEDERYIGNRPYHYNGSGRTYYLKGEAFGKAMLELLSRVTFKDLKPYLDDITMPTYRALKKKDYVAAYSAYKELEVFLDAPAPLEGPSEEDENRRLAFDVMSAELMGVVRPAVAEIADLRDANDLYALSLIADKYRRKFAGIDIYDVAAGNVVEELKTKEARSEISLGKKFYKYIEKLRKVEAPSKGPRDAKAVRSIEKYLGKMADDNPDSIYGKAARFAATELADVKKAVAEPAAYVRAAKKES